MSAAPSYPPVLDPQLAESEKVRGAQRDLDTLMSYAAAKQRSKPITTISTPATPSILEPPAQHRWCFSCGVFVFDPHWVVEDGCELPACWECAHEYREIGRVVR